MSSLYGEVEEDVDGGGEQEVDCDASGRRGVSESDVVLIKKRRGKKGQGGRVELTSSRKEH